MTGVYFGIFVRKKLMEAVECNEIKAEERVEVVSDFPKSNHLPF